MDNIVQLTNGKPNECCVKTLEILLEEAKAGRLVGIAFIGLQCGVETRQCAGITEEMYKNPFETIGMLSLIRMMVEEGIELP